MRAKAEIFPVSECDYSGEKSCLMIINPYLCIGYIRKVEKRIAKKIFLFVCFFLEIGCKYTGNKEKYIV